MAMCLLPVKGHGLTRKVHPGILHAVCACAYAFACAYACACTSTHTRT